MKTKQLTLVLMVMMLFLAACGGGAEEAAPAETASNAVTLDVAMNDIYYGDAPDNADNPPTWTVPAGGEMTINLENNGGLEHNFAVVRLGEEVPVPYVDEEHNGIVLMQTGAVDPGATLTDTLTAPTTPGEYIVICTIAGHYPSMQGRLIVTES